ncbi:MAG TPA: PASTA domain-containing protein [Solirubrobacteraceae bacterium]|jgi:beta-lactam-binding protein with PASTA domain|nr:PASTA domain-containing protein [Solirubrobacteraceae bacterium]
MSVTCRSCGFEYDGGGDFCPNCGEYLRWELTRSRRAAAEKPAEPAEPAPPAPAEPPPPPTEPLPPDPPVGGQESAPPASGAPEAGPTPPFIPPPPPPEPPPAFAPPPPAFAPPPPPFILGGEQDVLDLLGEGAHPIPPTLEHTAALADLPPIAPPPVVEPEPALPDTGGATLVVRWAEADPGAISAEEAAVAPVAAGGRAIFLATLRNTSRIVENYDLVTAWLPAGWTAVTPSTVYLVPFGSGGQSEQSLRVEVSPPRSPTSEARRWPLRVLAVARTNGGIAARADAAIDIAEFNDWVIEAEPRSRAARLRARYAVTLTNAGNGPIDLWLYAVDADAEIKGSFAARRMPLSPTESRTTYLELRPPRPRLIGRVRQHVVTIEALPDAPEPEGPKPTLKERLKRYVTGPSVSVGPHGVTVRKPRVRLPRPPQKQYKLEELKLRGGGGVVGPVAPSQVIFRHKPIISTWMIILALLIGGLVALYILTRNHQVTVPRLVGLHNTFAAEEKARAAHLQLDPTEASQPTNAVAPGTIVAQFPAAGARVNKGTLVSLKVAVGTGYAIAPNVVGLTRAKAEEKLGAAQLSLGEVEPITAPLTWVVGSQIPVAGQRLRDGTAVDVFLKAPPLTKKQKAEQSAAAKKKSAAAAAAAAAAKKVIVPPIAGKKEAAYAQAVGAAGLVPKVVPTIEPQKVGTLTSVRPGPGTSVKAGSSVQLLVSAGIPDVVYDNGSSLTFVNPMSGAVVSTVTGPDPVATEVSFSPHGTLFVYRSATRVFMAQAKKPTKPMVIYSGPDTLTNVTYAPDPKTSVFAMVRTIEGIGALCLSGFKNKQLHPQCLPDDGWNLGRSVSWRADGREILVFGTKPGNPSTFGILRFTSRKAFSTDPANWHGHVASQVDEPGHGVIDAQFSPSGKQVALVTNLLSAYFQVVITSPAHLIPSKGKALPVHACQVAWRPDGLELTVVQSDDLCTEAPGSVIRFYVADPHLLDTLGANGMNPVYAGLASPPS